MKNSLGKPLPPMKRMSCRLRDSQYSGQGILGTEQSKERIIACPQETQVILFISVFGRIVLLDKRDGGKGSGFSSYLFCGAFCVEFLCRALSPPDCVCLL